MNTNAKMFSECRRDLESKKKQLLWATLVMGAIPLLVAGGNAIISGMGGLSYYISHMMYICGIWFLFVPVPMRGLNMEKREKRLKKEIEKEEREIEEMKKAQANKTSVVPAINKKTASNYIFGRKKKPLWQAEKELEVSKVNLDVYIASIERTFWQYFKSLKWLKKVK
ncbi:MAG: hypothetical protein NTY80_02305 [candidate division SR1 bacterium]|nr:hypothetical protein [candidate division SR1 bacterium]